MKLYWYCKMPLLHEQARAFSSTHSCSSYHRNLSASGCIFPVAVLGGARGARAPGPALFVT